MHCVVSISVSFSPFSVFHFIFLLCVLPLCPPKMQIKWTNSICMLVVSACSVHCFWFEQIDRDTDWYTGSGCLSMNIYCLIHLDDLSHKCAAYACVCVTITAKNIIIERKGGERGSEKARANMGKKIWKTIIDRSISIRSTTQRESNTHFYYYVLSAIWIFIASNRSRQWLLGVYLFVCAVHSQNSQNQNRRKTNWSWEVFLCRKFREFDSVLTTYTAYIDRNRCLSGRARLCVCKRLSMENIQYGIDSIGHFYFVRLIDSNDTQADIIHKNKSPPSQKRT